MIEKVEFQNFRNLKGEYSFDTPLCTIFGKNNSGKTNILDGIRLAFSCITNDYFKINKSDFYKCDDSNPIIIKVKLKNVLIKSLQFFDETGKEECGFIATIKKSSNGRYYKKVQMLNGAPIDYDILREDSSIPNIFFLPLIRTDNVYAEWLTTGISKFIDSDEKYKNLKKESRDNILKSMDKKIDKFKSFCRMFNQDFNIELSEPKITDEKVFIVNGKEECDYCFGAGYKSIANIILNAMEDKYNIILIDELENHLHPSLIRTLIREIKNLGNNLQIIATTHSPIIVNELSLNELIDASGICLSKLSLDNRKKIEKFLHPGRSEIVFAENIILVEGYTEEMLLKFYLESNNNQNWTIVNVAGVMFEPYIELCNLLNKKVLVISDTDIILNYKSDGNDSGELVPSDRFQNLKRYCENNNVKLLEVYNTLESDLYKNGYLSSVKDLLINTNIENIYIAKNGKKTLIVDRLIDDEVDLSNWHIIKDIRNEFNSN